MAKPTLITALLAVVWLPPAFQAQEVSPASLYNAALTLERNLREPGEDPSLQDFRTAIAAYEALQRRFPTSTYDHHALWQSAGIAIEAYDRYRQHHDLEEGVRLLRTLEQRHPESPFSPRVSERRQQLEEMTRLAWLNAIDRNTDGDVVSLSISIDRKVRYRSGQLDEPPRLFFDFPRTEAAPPLRNATLIFDEGADTTTALRSVRLGRHPQHMTRVVLDVADPTSCSVYTLDAPFRLIIDCALDRRVSNNSPPILSAAAIPPATVPPSPAEPRSVLQSEFDALRFRAIAHRLQPTLIDPEDLPPLGRHIDIASTELVNGPLRFPIPTLDHPPPSSDSTGEVSIAQQLGLRVSRIVIDPGHGGHDPGARALGLSEADIVLDIARRLVTRLSAQPGLEVIMTRRGDGYVPLHARTRLANRVQADLFLSIHANASRSTEVRGVETYFLNLASDPDAQRVAVRENTTGLKTMHDLDGLLQSIATNSRSNESLDFATTIQRSLVRTLRTVDPDIPDLGLKQAPFVVLIGAQMPSILTEISFLTNRQDATLLDTAAYRDLIATALFDGIIRYRTSLNPTPRLALQVFGEDF